MNAATRDDANLLDPAIAAFEVIDGLINQIAGQLATVDHALDSYRDRADQQRQILRRLSQLSGVRITRAPTARVYVLARLAHAIDMHLSQVAPPHLEHGESLATVARADKAFLVTAIGINLAPSERGPMPLSSAERCIKAQRDA